MKVDEFVPHTQHVNFGIDLEDDDEVGLALGRDLER